MNSDEDLDLTTNKIFISYSRKDSLDVAEFRSTPKYRNFEILIDDEEITFNKPWKANIKKKILDSKGAILFLSGNALNPESPIRTLELPLIAERFSDPDDDFYFFPILLEDIDKELFENYNFTPLGSQEPVNFLEYFQLYDLKSNLTLKNLSLRKRKREYQILNADISNALEGGTKSPGRKRIKRARQRKALLSGLALAFLLFGSLVFTNTEAFAQIRYQVLKYAYDTFSAENATQDNNAFANVIASQISEIDDLESLGADDAFIEELAEVEEINSQLESQQDSSFFNSLVGNEDTTTTTSTTVATAPTTTTTSSSGQTTTTTTPVTTTTLVSSSADTTAPTFTQALTALNITTSSVDLNWSASDNVGVSYYVLKEGSSEIYRGSGTTKELEGILSGNNYTLTVYAYDAAGNSNTSSVSFTTLGSSTSSTTTSTTSTSTTTTSTTTTSTTTIPLAGLCSNENYPQYERLPSDTELSVVWMRVDENCNQNYQPVGGKASAYCFNCGHPFGGSGSNQGVWVWSHMFTSDGNHAGIGSGGVFDPVSKIWSFPSSGLSYYQGECTGSNGCDPSDSYSVITTTSTTTTTTTSTTTTTTTSTTTTTLPTTIGPTLNSLSISEDWLFENDQLTYNYSASPGTLDWGGNERIYFELSNGYVSPKVYCNIWKGSNVSSGSYSYQLSNSSDCSQNGRYFLDKVKVRAGSSNPAEITYDLLTGLVSCDSNWLNYSSEPCPSSHSFSRYTLSPFYNTGDNSGLDYIGYETCSSNGDGTYSVSIRAVMVSGGVGYWNVFYSTDNNVTKTYFEIRTINSGEEYTYTIQSLSGGLRIITSYTASKYPYFFLLFGSTDSFVLNDSNCS